MKRRYYRVVAFLLVAVVMGAAATIVLAQTPANEQTPPAQPGEIPFLARWQGSAHADLKDEPFNHWNTEGAVPTSCAKCHSTPGFLDYMGMDGSQFRVVDKPAPIGTTIQCIACHNDRARTLTSVKFPSGVELGLLEASNRCAECHQGRASKVDVDGAIKNANVTDVDTVSDKLSFVNIHYFAAAATIYGSLAHGGYEYSDMAYQPRNTHVEGYQTCKNCHDPHTLQIKVGECSGCHSNVTDQESLKNIRMNGSLTDYDGDGNITEGIAFEIATLQEKLVNTIKSYAVQVSGRAIGYNAASYPYFFYDANGNGQIDPDEARSANAYKSFTPRLLKAAYNYQVSVKDPGAFAHNPKYVIELLHDSINDLSAKVGWAGLSAALRDDPGHFAGSQEPWRHWDAAGQVPKECVRCHTDVGLPMYLKNGTTIAVRPAESMKCITCHDNMQNWALLQAGSATFPSGAVLSLDNNQSNLCIQCHQGRESKNSVDTAIQRAGVGPNQVSSQLRFINPHYFGAGAILFGTQAKGMYEYAGKQYDGRFMHVPSFNNCNQCHDVHRLNVKVEQCAACHTNVKEEKDVLDIRMTPIDFDGDGNVSEGMSHEVETMRTKLLEAIQRYAANTAGTAIAYSRDAYPYFFVDANGNGQVDPGETISYNAWTPALLKAAFNLQWAYKDPGNFAHNGQYVLQVLYDSLQDIGGNQAVAGMTRPTVR